MMCRRRAQTCTAKRETPTAFEDWYRGSRLSELSTPRLVLLFRRSGQDENINLSLC
jgi:hypothetical protein